MMRAQSCDQESRILRAVGSRRAPDPEVQDHLASCEACREAASVSQWMQTLSDTTGEMKSLPDPALLWWKAQLLRRWEAERRVAKPIERMQRWEVVAGTIGLAVMVVWQWADISRVFGSLNPGNLTHWTAVANASPYLPVALVGTVLLGVMVLAGVHRMLAES
jgi:predicted anti-sigma-YlaC factor YlaD